MENWNNGFWETGTVVYWQNTMTRKLMNEEFPYKIIIPTFPGPDPWPRPGISTCGDGKQGIRKQ